MRRITFLSILAAISVFMMTVSCSGNQTGKADAVISVDADTLINTGYIGNGAQWDPYSLDYGNGHVDISESDWEKIYARLDNMKPAFIRMMQNTDSRVKDGVLDTLKGMDHISKLLDYCQSRNVTVLFGDWGGNMVDPKAKTVNRQLIGFAADFVKYLVEDRGYTCIKYYNLINEPNGDWSVTNTDFELWSDAMLVLGEEFKAKGISDKIHVVGPDAAIWTADEAWWIGKTHEKLGDVVDLYDIHTYPSKVTINSGKYSEIISAYKAQVPQGHKIVMGEIGIKFVDPADSLLNAENIRRANECESASKSDSQMFVFDYVYGTDMADALFQTINSGFSGSVVWMLDDAMHTHETNTRLKVWGFWNIFGDEIFGSDKETVRPWYYAWSLLCRYIPAGSDFNEVSVEGEACIKAVSVLKDGRRTIAFVNVGKEDKTVAFDAPSLGVIKDAALYRYGEGLVRTEGDCGFLPEQDGVDFDFTDNLSFSLPAESMIVITNME